MTILVGSTPTPADQLIDGLEEVAAERCVIGIRRRSAVSKMVLGRNAHRILLESPAPCSP